MRVALITDGIWPYVLGGMQKHSYYLCKYLARNKVSVDLFHFNQSNYNISELEFFSSEEKEYIHSYLVDFPKSIRFPGHYIYNSYRHSKIIFNLIKDKLAGYEFIYTKGFTGWYLINQKYYNKITCAPIGVKFHGYEMFQRSPDFKIKLQHVFLLRQPVRAISRKADIVFSYGGKITDIVRSLGVRENKIFELASGVEEALLVKTHQPASAKIRFLFLGRYERRKGIEELNTAIKSILSDGKYTNIEFNFIGPIPESKRLTSAQVVYHGEIRGREGLQQLIANHDILICPSWSEGLPNVILEAMANGLAVIATNVGATNVVVSEATGWLIDRSNSDDIKSTIESLLTIGPAAINQKKQNALKLMREHFTWEQLIHKFIARFLR